MELIKFSLKFPVKRISEYAALYSYSKSETEIINNSDAIRTRRYLTKAELELIANWKSPRSKRKIASNPDEFVREISKVALTTNNEKLRIEILTLLDGVSWPTASTILHFYHDDKYPILDFRALYSVNCEHVLPRHYNFEFWRAYTEYARMLSDQAKLNMRDIDKALWQYSKLKQKP